MQHCFFQSDMEMVGIYSTTIYLPTYRLTCYRIANIEGRASWYMVHYTYLLYNISSKIIHSSNCFYLVWYYYTVLSNILGIQLCILLYLIKTSCYKLITWPCHYYTASCLYINMVFRFETFGAVFSTQIPCNSVQFPRFSNQF